MLWTTGLVSCIRTMCLPNDVTIMIAHAMNGEYGRAGSDQLTLLDGRRVGDGRAQLSRLLLVDDDPTMQNVVINYLEEHNMRVVAASRRQDAQRQLTAIEPDLVILDLR